MNQMTPSSVLDDTATATAPESAPESAPDPALGALARWLCEQVPDLVRRELRLHQEQVELTRQRTRTGTGIGMLRTAGLLGFLGLLTLVAAAVFALALAMPAWAAATVVGVAMFLCAGVLALLGKNRVDCARWPVFDTGSGAVRRER